MKSVALALCVVILSVGQVSATLLNFVTDDPELGLTAMIETHIPVYFEPTSNPSGGVYECSFSLGSEAVPVRTFDAIGIGIWTIDDLIVYVGGSVSTDELYGYVELGELNGSVFFGTPYMMLFQEETWSREGLFGHGITGSWEVVHETAPVPEPTTMLLFGTGIAGLIGTRIRRGKKT